MGHTIEMNEPTRECHSEERGNQPEETETQTISQVAGSRYSKAKARIKEQKKTKVAFKFKSQGHGCH